MCIDTETSEEELRSQTDTIKKLIEFAKKYQVAVILVCHHERWMPEPMYSQISTGRKRG